MGRKPSPLGIQIHLEGENLEWSEEEGSSASRKSDLPDAGGFTSKDLLFRIATCGLLGPLLQLWTSKDGD